MHRNMVDMLRDGASGEISGVMLRPATEQMAKWGSLVRVSGLIGSRGAMQCCRNNVLGSIFRWRRSD